MKRSAVTDYLGVNAWDLFVEVGITVVSLFTAVRTCRKLACRERLLGADFLILLK